MRAARVDLNQASIVAALRDAGATVQSLASMGKGVPDLLVSHEQQVWVVEVKGPKGTLTPEQVEWIAAWQAPVHIVRTADDALRVIGVIE